ncbi:MAG TPA: FAD-binding oxidoreductase [Candidatus Paceibacterota bacterium]|nr:FAD-binding oxidoreductase [Candidatus Paceibacterota bacterium]
MASLGEDLRKIVKGEVDENPAALEAASRDASLFVVKPEVVVRPQDAADVQALVRYAAERKKTPKTHISLTARAAGTDMSGGPLTDSIVLDMTAHFNRVLEVGSKSAVVEPGTYFRDFDKETKKQNLELPSYTASRELCTVGGMIANNSGGEKNLKYGKTARYVEELEVVLSDGEVHTLRNLEGDALKRKLAEQSFEGDLYRKVSRLVSSPENKRIIEAHKPTVEKNSSGYALWDIGDGVSSLNLARLMVGAQGTLGIITKAKVGLVHPMPYAAMTVIFINSLSQLGTIVPQVLKYEPDSFESYDDHTFHIALKYFPEFASQMKSGIISLGLQFLPEVWMALTGGVPKLILMVEFRSHSQREALAKAERLAADLTKGGEKVKVRVARDEDAARKFWTVRHESFNLLRKKIRGKRTAPFIDDFVVDPLRLPEFLPKLENILLKYEFTYTIAGHVGDGNFHIIPLVDPKDPKTAKVIDELSHKVYDLVAQFKGSISGEHNDGLIRTPYVEQMFGREMYALFMQVNQIFDPLDIFNPGKKVGTTFSDAFSRFDLAGVKPSQEQARK